MQIIKKDGTREPYIFDKIIKAISKSADRVNIKLSENNIQNIKNYVENQIKTEDEIPVTQMHNIVEGALDMEVPDVAKSYKDYRNYKTSFVKILDDVYKDAQKIMYIGDKENANSDSALISTKRSLIYNVLNKELYKKFFLNQNEIDIIKDGYLYIHDMSARRDTLNCCLIDISNVLTNGFEMGNIWYNEPNSLDTAFDVIGDIIFSTSAQQYGKQKIAVVKLA